MLALSLAGGARLNRTRNAHEAQTEAGSGRSNWLVAGRQSKWIPQRLVVDPH